MPFLLLAVLALAAPIDPPPASLQAGGERPQRAGGEKQQRAGGEKQQRAGGEKQQRAGGEKQQRAGGEKQQPAGGEMAPRAGSRNPQGYGGEERPAALDPLGRAAAAAIHDTWSRESPAIDAALSRAAQAIAVELARGVDLEVASRPESLRLALARAGATSPELAPLLVRASTRALALQRLRDRLAAEPGQPPALVGVGASEGGGRTALVVLRAARRVALDPFPAQVTLGMPHRLTGAVLAPLARPTLYLTAPGGVPSRLAAQVEGRRFAAVVHFARAGRYTLEVLGEGPQGPEVAALLEVWAGERMPDAIATPAHAAEPEQRADKETFAARLANDLRKERGLAPLRVDPKLAGVARAYAEELLRTGRFAHHSPTSGALGDRLAKAGYGYRGAGENLAQAPNVRQAHQSTVASPGHLANLVDPAWSAAGFGVATNPTASGGQTVVLVQIFAQPNERK